MNSALLNAVFGPNSQGATVRERARSSDVLFVRSRDQLAVYREGATGRVLTAEEALADHGERALLEAFDKGAAIICDSTATAGAALRTRREELGLEVGSVAGAAGLPAEDVRQAEESKKRVPIHRLERIARVLGLEDRWIASGRANEGSGELAGRLRSLRQERTSLTPSVILSLAEAAWIGRTQVRLEEQLGILPDSISFSPQPVYQDASFRRFEQGYWLAQDTRKLLGFGDDRLPMPFWRICQERLGVPVVQTEMHQAIAGATVTTGTTRTLVVNMNGKNVNVLVRRSTYAHELCHILWDQTEELHTLRVDEYAELERKPGSRTDPVEQRANAFSAELVAPKEAAARVFRDTDGPNNAKLRAVMDHFGVSFWAGRHQVANGLRDQAPELAEKIEELHIGDTSASDEATGTESYTADYFPLPRVPAARTGRFAGVVVCAAQHNLISWETAAEYLLSPEEDVRSAADTIRELFPGLPNPA